MTKLTEWLSALAVLFAIWYALVSKKIDNEFTKQHATFIMFSPLILLILFGALSAAVVLYRVFTFNDCEQAEKELVEEIREAKTDLKKLGFRFKSS